MYMAIYYGYGRVSAKDQNLARQIAAMRAYGVKKENIFVDKLSGKDFNRPEYRKLVKRMRKGDVLVVKSIDRLGRNYDEIREQWRYLTKVVGIQIVVLDMPLLNTAIDQHGLVERLICDIVLELLAFVAENERDNIRQRQAEGIALAKARGVQFGRPRIERGPEFDELKNQWQQGMASSRDAGEILGVAHVTFLRWVRAEK